MKNIRDNNTKSLRQKLYELNSIPNPVNKTILSLTCNTIGDKIFSPVGMARP